MLCITTMNVVDSGSHRKAGEFVQLFISSSIHTVDIFAGFIIMASTVLVSSPMKIFLDESKIINEYEAL